MKKCVTIIGTVIAVSGAVACAAKLLVNKKNKEQKCEDYSNASFCPYKL